MFVKLRGCLSNGFVSRLLQIPTPSIYEIDKTVEIFENVAFSGSHFLEVYIYCKLKTYLFLTLSLLVIVYAILFIISLNIGQKTRY